MHCHRRIAQDLIAAMSIALSLPPAWGATSHEFCVTRLEVSGPSTMRARIYFQGVDPGRQIAGETLIQHYRRIGRVPIRLDDDTGGACKNADTHHITVDESAKLDQPARADEGIPDIGRAARKASGALIEVAQEASRLMCRMLPC